MALQELLVAEPRSALAMKDMTSALIDLAGLLIEQAKDGDADRSLTYLEGVAGIEERLMPLRQNLPPLLWNVVVKGADSTLSVVEYAEIHATATQHWPVKRLVDYLRRTMRVRQRLRSVYPETPGGLQNLMTARNRLAQVENGRIIRPR